MHHSRPRPRRLFTNSPPRRTAPSRASSSRSFRIWARFSIADAGDSYAQRSDDAGPVPDPNIRADIVGAFTNCVATDAYRGAGRPEATHGIERMVDMLAAELKMDPAEIRLKNFVQNEEFPFPTATGLVTIRATTPLRCKRPWRWPATTSFARSRPRHAGRASSWASASAPTARSALLVPRPRRPPADGKARR